MIRIYLDWNVISALKRSEFEEIRDFIYKYKKHLIFPYTSAHFTDLMKSYSVDNPHFETDLKTLESLSNKHFMEWEKDQVKPILGSSSNYFEHIKEKHKENLSEVLDIDNIFKILENVGGGEISNLLKSICQLQPAGINITEENKDLINKLFPNLKADSSLWDLMKDITSTAPKLLQDGSYYKDFRKTIGNHGFKLESNSGNWNYDEVIKNIDHFLSQLESEMTYIEYVKTAYKDRKEPINLYEYYTSAYLMLDLIGYKTDKLRKSTDNMQNIQADGIHSFYAAHCDFLVTDDKNLRIKSKVLYNEFKVSTKIIEPKELIPELSKVIDNLESKADFRDDITKFCNKEYFVKSIKSDNNDPLEKHIFKLPKFYFNYFNYMIYEDSAEQQGIIISFLKEQDNFSGFIYYSEIQALVDLIIEYFGYEAPDELESKKNKFIYDNKEVTFEWKFEGGFIVLEKDTITHRPVLSYILLKEKN